MDPSWPEPTGAPRILVENPDPAMAWANARELDRAGYQVVTCLGPEGAPDLFPFGRCRLVDRGVCPLAEDADVVVFGLRFGHDRSRGVFRALRAAHPGLPICVEAPASELERGLEEAEDVWIIPFPTFPGRLSQTVEDVLSKRAKHPTRRRRDRSSLRGGSPSR